MRSFFFSCVTAIAMAGCASANGGAGGEGSVQDASTDDDASSSDDGGAEAAPANHQSWSYIYTTYFAKGATPGHCGNSTCHSSPNGGFLCSSKANCYSSITGNNANIGGKLVDPKAPDSSILLDSANSPVFWFDPRGGGMPEDKLVANDAAVTEITAWVMAGAPND